MVSNIACNPHGIGCGETLRAAQWYSVLFPCTGQDKVAQATLQANLPVTPKSGLFTNNTKTGGSFTWDRISPGWVSSKRHETVGTVARLVLKSYLLVFGKH